MHIALVHIAAALGVKMLAEQDDPRVSELDPPAGPSIAEIAAQISPPRAGADTLSASLAAIKAMRGS